MSAAADRRGAAHERELLVVQVGRRWYLTGDASFDVRNVLKDCGFTWDRERRGWWTGDESRLQEAAVRLERSALARMVTERLRERALSRMGKRQLSLRGLVRDKDTGEVRAATDEELDVLWAHR